MKNKFKNKYKEKIQQLPEINPEINSWKKISDALDFHSNLSKRSSELPQIVPKIDSWEKISNTVEAQNNNNKTIVLNLTTVKYILRIAAILIIIIGIYFLYQINNTSVTISESVEEITIEEINLEQDDSELINYINYQCRTQITICQNSDFQNKKEQFEEVQSDLKKINEIIDQYGESVSLIKTQTKMENIKSRLIKDMLKTLQS